MKSIKTKYFVFHPLSYGTATLARVSFRRSDGRALMFHYFPPHEATTFHDHPWPFTTLVLWGSYTDLTPCEKCAGQGFDSTVNVLLARGSDRWCTRCGGSGVLLDRVRMGERRRRPATHRHRTIVRHRTFTVVVCGRTEREWCEGTPDEWECGGVETDFAEGLGMPR